MKIIITGLLLFYTMLACSQKKGDNTIIVKNVGFIEVCNALLDAGYVIDKKDNELQTAKTESRIYPKYWNAYYSVNIRVRDSTVYISGTFTGPGKEGGLFKDEPIENIVNRNGETQKKSISGYPFLLLNNVALAFGKPVTYSKQ